VTARRKAVAVAGCAAAALLAAGCATAQSPAVARAGDDTVFLETWVDSVAAEVMAADRIPGAALVIVRDGEVVLSKGYGLADIAGTQPVTVDGTIFRIGSVTKVLTALALAGLIDQGSLELDAPLSEYLTGDFLAGPNGEPITVRHLLSHSAGFDQVGMRRQVDDPARRPSIAEFVSREVRPVRAPGQVGVYDTYGITLAGHLVERLSGLSYADYMRRHVFQPLGMSRSRVEIPASERGTLATGYGIERGQLVPQKYEWYVTLPASSVDATVADMGRLLLALLGDGGPLLSAGMAARVRNERLLGYGEMGAFSWGFWEENRNGYRALHHGGIMAGYSSELYIVPEAGVGFFVAYNRDPETGPPARLREAIIDLVYSRLLPDRGPQPPSLDDPLPVSPDRFAGAYGGTVGCFTCDDGEGWPITSVLVAAEGPGTLSMYGGTAQLVAVDRTTFISRRSGNEVRFLADSAGRIRYLVQGPNSFAKLDDTLLAEMLGPDWRSAPAHPLVARVRFANQDWPAAARAYHALTQRRPENGRYHFNYGFAELHNGNYEAAETAFRRALDLGQWRAWSQYYIAAARAGAGDLPPAWDALDSAIGMGFNDANLLRTEPWWQPHKAASEYQSALARIERE
jgi:CubicO group peptidase (beta-lactamase class C family)